MRNILSIDGGGVRAYLPLRFLNEIEKRTQIPICQLFDYFTGVSSSSLICSLLLLKDQNGNPQFTTDKILELFKEECKKIFSFSYLRFIKTGLGLLGPKYTNESFRDILVEYFKDTKIEDLSKPLCILSFDLTTDKNFYFDSPNFLVKECILCSTAAPTYFYPYNYPYDQKDHAFIDGGVVTNNPAEVCFIKSCEKYPQDDFYSISIGTGYTSIPTFANYGILGWSSTILDTLFDANSQCQIEDVTLLEQMIKKEGGNTLHRINFLLEKDISLDDIHSFDRMEKIMEDWIQKNTTLLDDLCSELVKNVQTK